MRREAGPLGMIRRLIRRGYHRTIQCYGTPASFDMTKIDKRYGNREGYQYNKEEGIIHMKDHHKGNHLFIFAFGSIIEWGEYPTKDIQQIFTEHQVTKKDVEVEEYSYIYGHKHMMKGSHITLKDDDTHLKLALSYGLGQSIKLNIFENQVEEMVNIIKPYPLQMIQNGKIRSSYKDITKQIGQILFIRNQINLGDTELLLNKPELFWDHIEASDLWEMTVHTLMIKSRVNILNQQLRILDDMNVFLSNQLATIQSKNMELAIVSLITVEVALWFVEKFVL